MYIYLTFLYIYIKIYNMQWHLLAMLITLITFEKLNYQISFF